MKKRKISQFVGKQLSRMKAGQSYYMIIIQTVTALGVLKMALPQIDAWIFIFLFPLALFGAFLLGYLMDKSDVIVMDHRKSLDMTHRYVNTADLKAYGFRIVMIKTMFHWMKSVKNNEPIDFEIWEKYYKEYLKDWNPPDEEE